MKTRTAEYIAATPKPEKKRHNARSAGVREGSISRHAVAVARSAAATTRTGPKLS